MWLSLRDLFVMVVFGVCVEVFFVVVFIVVVFVVVFFHRVQIIAPIIGEGGNREIPCFGCTTIIQQKLALAVLL